MEIDPIAKGIEVAASEPNAAAATGIRAELDAMLDFSSAEDALELESLGTATPESAESSESPESTETPAAAEPATSSELATPAEPAASEVPQTPVAAAPVDVTALQAQLEEMRQLLASTLTAPSQPQVAAPPASQAQPVQQAVAQQPAQPIQQPAAIVPYVSSLKEMEDALASPEAFNALLGKVHSAAVEQAMRVIPQMTRSIASEELRLQEVTREFYRVNNDLADQPETLSKIANAIAMQNPNMRLEDLMLETEKRARVILNRPRKQQLATTAPNGTQRRPAFPNATSGGAAPPPAPAKSRKQSLADELAELNSLQ